MHTLTAEATQDQTLQQRWIVTRSSLTIRQGTSSSVVVQPCHICFVLFPADVSWMDIMDYDLPLSFGRRVAVV